MEAGIDSAGHYAFDVFKNLSSLDANKQQDFRAVVRFAARMADASVTQLQSLVLSHRHFPANVGSTIGTSVTRDYAPWTEMIQAWATDLINKLYTAASSSTLRAVGLRDNGRRNEK